VQDHSLSRGGVRSTPRSRKKKTRNGTSVKAPFYNKAMGRNRLLEDRSEPGGNLIDSVGRGKRGVSFLPTGKKSVQCTKNRGEEGTNALLDARKRVGDVRLWTMKERTP